MAFPANFDKCNSAKFLEKKKKNEPSVKSYFFCELSDMYYFGNPSSCENRGN